MWINFQFTVVAAANNTTIQIRSVGPAGANAPLTYTARQADATITGIVSGFYEVTQADLDGGPVFVLMERNISNNVIWEVAQIVVQG